MKSVWLGALLALLLVAGCGQSSTTSAPASPSSTKSWARSTPKPATERCSMDAPITDVDIPAPDGASLRAAVVGDGPHAAVMLHQTYGALCGWMPFSTIVGGKDIKAIAIDICGFGFSYCPEPFGSDPQAQVRAAVDWARAQGATSVTVVGASMGGAIALGTAQPAGADAVIDLSGPATWTRVPEAGAAAKDITIPLLLAVSPDDREMQPDVLKKAFDSAPSTTKRFVSSEEGGHGWDLLTKGSPDAKITPLGKIVASWIKGDYVGA